MGHRHPCVVGLLLLGCGDGPDGSTAAMSGETTTTSETSTSERTTGDDTGNRSTGAETGVDTGSTSDAGTTGPSTPDCAVAGVGGTCIDVGDCPADATPFQALCDGPPRQQCCVDEAPPCSVDGAPGLCISVDACTDDFVRTAGLCPGDASIQCCTDPRSTCDPRAMPLPNDGLIEQPGDPGCLDGMVASDGFCIDQYEASLVVIDDQGDIVGSWSPYFNPGSIEVRAVSLPGAIPQGYVDQVQAEAACVAAGKRLCTDAEWLRACQGASSMTYPYGDTLEPGVCNDARTLHPVIEYFGTSESWIWSELDNACISQIPDSLHVTGRHEGCVSEDQVFDMMGNLHEWTDDPSGTFRGGFYADTMLNGPGCLYATTAHTTTHWDYSTGFRCCADMQ